MTKKIEDDRSATTTTADPTTTDDPTTAADPSAAPIDILGDPGSVFLQEPGDHEIDPGHLWIFRINGATTTLFGEVYVETLSSGMKREHWFLYTSVAGATHPTNATTLSKYVWPGSSATNITMKFSYNQEKLKKANGDTVTPADYRTYLSGANISTTYIISDPQVQ